MDLDFGFNQGFVEELRALYLENPLLVEPGWRTFFEAEEAEASRQTPQAAPFARPPSLVPPAPSPLDASFLDAVKAEPAPRGTGEILDEAAHKARVFHLMNAYRVFGHLAAHLNPLEGPPPRLSQLQIEEFGLSEADLDKPFPTTGLGGAPPVMLLREIVRQLEETYCRSIGVEFTFIEDVGMRRWLQEQMEATHNRMKLTPEIQLRILSKLTEAEVFEQFIHKSYEAGTKRFSLEGGESLIPLMDLLIERAGGHQVDEIVVGMAHRGRLNVLANIMGKSLRDIFAAFEDKDPEANLGGGDVKYHLGYSTDRMTDSGQPIHITLTFNPSHLEFVNPVVEGRTRAKQERAGLREGARGKKLPLLIHGDAAFIGQGIVAETLNLANVKGFTTGGTVHVIVNNQIGFTTDPEDSRSTRYASDITRILKIPVFHVNGEDPEAVAHVAQLAIDWRQRFGRDVVIDMYCYRRYGHNEGDEPRYTQPLMYSAIDRKESLRDIYVKHLVALGNITVEKANEIAKTHKEALADTYDEVKKTGFAPVRHFMGGVWRFYRGGPDSAIPEVPTGVPAEKLIALSEKMLELPPEFKIHPKALPILKARHDKLVAGEPFDWGTGELLAYATLLADKTPVRLSGQDVQRGTFSHRHAVLRDMETNEPYSPLWRVASEPARFEAYNSPLSEAGVLGFEFGYSLDYPDALVIWEAQFGDFLNGAQVIVDQFITSSEDKWHLLTGLVMYLPHGYEGQGPEHSSARLERFLQNSAEDNIQVVNPTTPAQLFHVLRRQVLRPWRKPLVLMTPKSLLRVAATSKGPHRPVSVLNDLVTGRFQRVIPDSSGIDPSDVKKILLCSGKIYYDLAQAREVRGIRDVAIVRLEQLYPLNDSLVSALAPYKDGTKLVWVQEEPRNYGSFYYINAILPGLLHHRFPLSCVSRANSASPATGSRSSHLLEQKMLMDEAFS